MDSDRVIHLLAKKIGNAASIDELTELEGLLTKHPEFSFFKELIASIESDKQHHGPVIEKERLIAENWSALKENLDTQRTNRNVEVYYPWMHKQKRRPFTLSIRWAAVWIGILLLTGSAFLVWKQAGNKQTKIVAAASVETMKTANGTPEKVVLPDGSVVWLNAGSHIKYTTNFIQDKREVHLDGEAYFKVKHDENHPFIVHAGNVKIRVLGTSFNVQAYENEDRIETTLIDGKIQVQIGDNPDKNIVLRPNEKLTVAHQTFNLSGKTLKEIRNSEHKELSFKVEELVSPKTVSRLPEMAWLQDKLAFQNEKFSELAKKLERRYGVDVVFEDTSLGNERLNGVFKNESIEKALRILQMTTPFKYDIVNDTVYLNGR